MHTANLSTVCKSTYPTLNFRKSRNKFLNCNNSVTQKVAILTFHAVLSLCNPDWTSTRWGGVIVTFCHIIHNKQSNLSNHQTTSHTTIYKMPHLHLSSLVTKKKIETGVIFFHSTSRLCTYPYLAHLLYIIKCVPHCPVLAAAAPDPTDVAAGKTDAAAGKTGTPTEYPATAHPTSTTCGQPSVTTTPNVGAPFMTPVARQGETTNEPNTPATARPTSATARPTPATVRAADILPPTGGSGRHKWRPYDTQTPR